MKQNLEIGALILRVVLGITFFAHGFEKFQGGIANTSGWFQSIGLPGFMAYVVALIELVGGAALIAGLGTRIVSALFVIVMLGATIKVKLAGGFLGGYELDLALMAIALYFVLNGSGKWSVDAALPSRNKPTN
ncbi:DoxX family protein [Paenibacillus lutrae]|uniref:DoxX family membrane protein n=1 Tax=Paenibacillus lutrae TaxID=2078573 RepID=A0A7X3FLB0_9BACL|nr:DoxX family protein [Paenibacillus lutrae]MVP01844.1 DoxX family membrane protein [Paenibacillus lutrae]